MTQTRKAPQHKIDEFLFDLSFESMRFARHQQAELSTWVSTQVLPTIDEIFDAYFENESGQQVLYLDRLEIDLGSVSAHDYQTEIPQRLAAKLRALLNEHRPQLLTREVKTVSDFTPATVSERAILDQFAEFLRSGRMPVLSNVSGTDLHVQMLEIVLRDHGAQLARVLRDLQASEHASVAIARLVQQFSEAHLVRVLRQIAPTHLDWVLDLMDVVELLPTQGSHPLFTNASEPVRVLWTQVLHALLTQSQANASQILRTVLIQSAPVLAVRAGALAEAVIRIGVHTRLAPHLDQSLMQLAAEDTAQTVSVSATDEARKAVVDEVQSALQTQFESLLASPVEQALLKSVATSQIDVDQIQSAQGNGNVDAAIPNPVPAVTSGNQMTADQNALAEIAAAGADEVIKAAKADDVSTASEAAEQAILHFSESELLVYCEQLQAGTQGLPQRLAVAALQRLLRGLLQVSLHLSAEQRARYVAEIFERAAILTQATHVQSADFYQSLVLQLITRAWSERRVSAQSSHTSSALNSTHLMHQASDNSLSEREFERLLINAEQDASADHALHQRRVVLDELFAANSTSISASAITTATTSASASATATDVVAQSIDSTKEGAYSPTPTPNKTTLENTSVQHRLAQALLQADASAIQDLWHDLVHKQPQFLRAAVMQYASRPEIRQQLRARFPVAMLLDLTDMLSPIAAQILRALYPHAGLLRALESAHTTLNEEDWQRRLWESSFHILMSALTRPVNSDQSSARIDDVALDPAIDLISHVRELIAYQTSDDASRSAVTRMWHEILRVHGLSLEPASATRAAASDSSVSVTDESVTEASDFSPMFAAAAMAGVNEVDSSVDSVRSAQAEYDANVTDFTDSTRAAQMPRSASSASTNDISHPPEDLLPSAPDALSAVVREHLRDGLPSLPALLSELAQRPLLLRELRLDVAEWTQLIRAQLSIDRDVHPNARADLFAAIDAQSQHAAQPVRYLMAVLQQLLANSGVDLDAALLASGGDASALEHTLVVNSTDDTPASLQSALTQMVQQSSALSERKDPVANLNSAANTNVSANTNTSANANANTNASGSILDIYAQALLRREQRLPLHWQTVSEWHVLVAALVRAHPAVSVIADADQRDGEVLRLLAPLPELAQRSTVPLVFYRHLAAQLIAMPTLDANWSPAALAEHLRAIHLRSEAARQAVAALGQNSDQYSGQNSNQSAMPVSDYAKLGATTDAVNTRDASVISTTATNATNAASAFTTPSVIADVPPASTLPSMAIASATAQELAAYCQQLRQGEGVFVPSSHSVAELQRLTRALVNSSSPSASLYSQEFLSAIESASRLSEQVHAFYAQVITHLIAGEMVDLEAILANADVPSASAIAEPRSLVSAPPLSNTTSHADMQTQPASAEFDSRSLTSPSPAINESHSQEAQQQRASDQVQNESQQTHAALTLQQRLIEALLKANPALIAPHWDALVREQSPLLRAALLQYLRRPEIRQQLRVRFTLPMLLDMSATLQPLAARMLRALYPHAELLRQIEPPHTSVDAEDWRRRVWESSFDELLNNAVGSDADAAFAPFDLRQHVSNLILRHSGSERRTQLALTAVWHDILQAERMLPVAGDVPVHNHRADEQVNSATSVRFGEPNAASPTATSASNQLIAHLCAQLQLDAQQLAWTDVERNELQTLNALDPETMARLLPAFSYPTTGEPSISSSSANASEQQAIFESAANLGRVLSTLLQHAPRTLSRVIDALRGLLPKAVDGALADASPLAQLRLSADVWRQLNLAHIALDVELNAESRQLLRSAIAAQAANARDAMRYQRAVFTQLLAREGLDLDSALVEAEIESSDEAVSENAGAAELANRVEAPSQDSLNHAAIPAEQAVAAEKSVSRVDALTVHELQSKAEVSAKIAAESATPSTANANTSSVANTVHSDPQLATSTSDSAPNLADLTQTADEFIQLLQSAAAGTSMSSDEQTRVAVLLSELSAAASKSGATSLIKAEVHDPLSQLFADAHRVQRVLSQLPESSLARLLSVTHSNQDAPLMRCMNMVADAVSLLTQSAGAGVDVARQQIAQAKWQALFEFVFVQKKPLQLQELARYLGDVLARACSIEGVTQTQHLRNLIQRRLALLMPEAAQSTNATKQAASAAATSSARRSAMENKNPNLQAAISLSDPDEANSVDAFSDGIPLMNAGMVLAAPYLPRLFAMLKLTVDGQFVDFYAKERAAHLLQFIVNGHNESAEYQLLLNKLLCGIGTAIPVRPDIELSEQEKTVAEQLLQGMIQNWNTIGKTSVNGLRETFLQRAGWIAFKDDAWQLKVQSGTFDMLLDRLPWSFSIIKYAWMEKPVHVTWR
jgi:Contractile injection system tape measure protein